jgi:hypothetical protein
MERQHALSIKLAMMIGTNHGHAVVKIIHVYVAHIDQNTTLNTHTTNSSNMPGILSTM